MTRANMVIVVLKYCSIFLYKQLALTQYGVPGNKGVRGAGCEVRGYEACTSIDFGFRMPFEGSDEHQGFRISDSCLRIFYTKLLPAELIIRNLQAYCARCKYLNHKRCRKQYQALVPAIIQTLDICTYTTRYSTSIYR